MGNILNVLFYEPLYNGIVVLYRLFDQDLGMSIIAIALISRIIMFPVTVRQVKMTESGQEYKEKEKAIKEKYKNNKDTQKEELLKLQQEYLPTQLAGCLPMIFQLIFFIYIYRVLKNIIGEGVIHFNEIAYPFIEKFPDGYSMNTLFVGNVDLAASGSRFGIYSREAIPYILLTIGVGIAQYGSMKVLTSIRNKKKVNEKKPKKKKNEPEDFAEIIQQSTQQAMMLMPVFIMFVSFNLPSGLSVYWISQSTFVIIQQLIVIKLSAKPEANTEQDTDVSKESLQIDKTQDKKKKKRKKKKRKVRK